MAKYLLRRTWFGPDGNRYRPKPGGVEISDALAKSLPSSAVKVGKDGTPEKKTEGGEPFALSELANTVNPPYDPEVKGGLQLSHRPEDQVDEEEPKKDQKKK